MIFLRQGKKEDHQEITKLVIEAFKDEPHSDQQEHKLVERIRENEAYIPELEMVACEEEKIVGHMMYSKIEIVDGEKVVSSIALAPLSVLPAYQRKGIGTRLVQQSLSIAKALGYESVIVLGNPEYYGRFGFKPTSSWGIQAPFDVPGEYYMGIELQEGALEDGKGKVRYCDAF